MRIRPVNMEFLYGTAFLSQSPEAYERLIIDAMRGDATLFTRNDEVEAQWRIIDPIIAGAGTDRGRGPLPTVRRPASQGPDEAERAARRRRRLAQRSRSPRRAPRTPSGARGTRRPRRSRRRCAACSRSATARMPRFVPARVLNLICIVEREWAGEIVNRLRPDGPLPPLAHDHPRGRARPHGRSTRWRRSPSEGDPRPGEFALLRETIVVRRRRAAPRAPRHDRRPARRHRPADRASGRRTATTTPSTALLRTRAGRAAGLRRRARRARRAAPVDRARPGARRLRRRPRLAAHDAVARAHRRHLRPRPLRPELRQLTTVDDPPPRATRASPALLLVGWLASRLGWRPRRSAPRPPTSSATRAPGARTSTLRARADPTQDVPGLAGLTSRPRRAATSRSTAGPAACARDYRNRRGDAAPMDGPRAPRAASPGSSARGSVRLSCATPPTSRRSAAAATLVR